MADAILHVLQHALGLDKYGEGREYRNHFVAGGADVVTCQQAVEQGLMIERQSSALSGNKPWYSVTAAGHAYVTQHSPAKPPEPKRTRSQQRYKRFLEYGDGFESFLAFCRWDAGSDRSWNQP